MAAIRLISANSVLVMGSFLLLSFLHLTASALLYCSVSPVRTKLFLPWLLSHLVIIATMTTVFICWTFITFFIDLLVSVVFPVISGLVLGLSILAWRLVLASFRNNLVRYVDCRGEVEGSSLLLSDN